MEFPELKNDNLLRAARGEKVDSRVSIEKVEKIFFFDIFGWFLPWTP